MGDGPPANGLLYSERGQFVLNLLDPIGTRLGLYLDSKVQHYYWDSIVTHSIGTLLGLYLDSIGTLLGSKVRRQMGHPQMPIHANP